MKFNNIQQRNDYFDIIIDSYNKADYETSETMIRALSNSEDRNLLYYIYKLDNNPHLYSFILDAIF